MLPEERREWDKDVVSAVLVHERSHVAPAEDDLHRRDALERLEALIQQLKPVDRQIMTLQLVRRWAHDAVSKRKQEHLTHLITTIFILVFAIVWGIRSSNLAERIGFFAAALWLVAGLYHSLFVQHPRRLPAEAGLSSTIEFLRQEIHAQKHELRLVWLRLLGPMFVVLGLIAIPKSLAAVRRTEFLSNSAPFLILLTLWFVLYYIICRNKTRRLYQELQDIDSLEQEANAGSKPPKMQ